MYLKIKEWISVWKLNSDTLSFECIYNLDKPESLSKDAIRAQTAVLANLYNLDPDKLFMEFKTFRLLHAGQTFGNFPALAKFILTSTSEKDFRGLHFLTQILLILPFASADCERSFSLMNKLKRAERTRLKEILNELMLLYDITPSEDATLDIRDLAQKLVDSWKT